VPEVAKEAIVLEAVAAYDDVIKYKSNYGPVYRKIS
jgi:hypothetical protein